MHRPQTRVRLRLAFLVVLVIGGAMFSSVATADPVQDLLCAVGAEDVNDLVGVTCDIETPAAAAVCQPGQPCETTVQDTDDNGDSLVTATLSGTSPTGGALVLALRRSEDEGACDFGLYVPYEGQHDTPGFTGAKTIRIQVAKSLRQEEANNGADRASICYTSPKPFYDADGNPTVEGLLPDCEEVPEGVLTGLLGSSDPFASPCLHRHAAGPGDHVINIHIPAGFGDPVWKLVGLDDPLAGEG